MKTNPILEEIWKVKDQLAHQAEGDLSRLCEQTREWSLDHHHQGPIIRSAADLRRLLVEHPSSLVAETAPNT